MAVQKAPQGLAPGGRKLWSAIVSDHELDAPQLVQLEEACRAKDRLDEFDSIIHGKGVLNLMRFRLTDLFSEDEERNVKVDVRFDAVIAQANATANLLKQLLAALRLPDSQTGKKPQYRGPRGAQKPSIPGGADTASTRAKQRWGA
jgi:hypothetical protein